MKKSLVLLAMIMVFVLFGCSKDPVSAPAQKTIYLTLSNVKIINDGNTFVNGNFYYKMEILDKDGVVIKNTNGYNLTTYQTRDQAVSAGDGQYIPINATYVFNKIDNKDEAFYLAFRLYDKFSSGTDINAGEVLLAFPNPWSGAAYTGQNIPIDLVDTTNTYKTQLIITVTVR
ncbi:MAG: hypothetical protein NT007_09905 [Candidatus Kapabacteria bacterium]|nr:hypothetical protein [Candidatus Kapabacteria bacterium]